MRYLVENSLGRLWLLNRPGSKLVEQMDYYIKPEQAGDRLPAASASPEEIKICDPACGSGHMLTYAFDLLYAIYEEEGYEPAEIPRADPHPQSLRHRDRRTRRGAGRLCPDHEGPRQAAPLLQQGRQAEHLRAGECPASTRTS